MTNRIFNVLYFISKHSAEREYADERQIKIMNFEQKKSWVYIFKEECSLYTQILYLVSVFFGRNNERGLSFVSMCVCCYYDRVPVSNHEKVKQFVSWQFMYKWISIDIYVYAITGKQQAQHTHTHSDARTLNCYKANRIGIAFARLTRSNIRIESNCIRRIIAHTSRQATNSSSSTHLYALNWRARLNNLMRHTLSQWEIESIDSFIAFNEFLMLR